jgi:sugar phosphate isomerase/epimerase
MTYFDHRFCFRYVVFFPVLILFFLGRSTLLSAQQTTQWKHLSSSTGQLPVPGKSHQQTGAVIYDFGKSGVNDFVLSFRERSPALVWYRRNKKGWDRYVIDSSYQTVEAGGAVYDIDQDGDPDLVMGADYQGAEVWWWENPYPNYDPRIPWKRHIIKNSGGHQHHDQAWGNFLQTEGKEQLAFWNQQVKTLFLATIPEDPKTSPWPFHAIFNGNAGESSSWYAEGIATGDVDGDGYTDLLAGNYWFKYKGNGQFKAVRFANAGGRLAVGKFKPGKTLQIVVSPGDGVGYLTWYECKGDPNNSASWQGHRLIDTPLIHCHSLSISDINGDGNLDIFAAEMGKWTEKSKQPDNPNAQAFIFYGDGKGHFKKTVFSIGIGYHEAKVADLDGDGDMDILDKPYNWKAPRVDVWLQHGTGKLLPSIRKTFKGKIGLELYSLRDNLQKDFDGTLKAIRKMGFTEVEVPQLYGRTAKGMKNALSKNDLMPTSLLCSYEQLSDSLPEIIQNAKDLNVKYVGCTWIPHGDQLTQEEVDKAAVLFNKIGAELKAQHLHFIYHTHGYEFVPTASGATLMDVLAREMKPGIADFEMDIFWVWSGGQDPALLLKKYPGRFVALHLKDMKEGTPTGQYSGSAPEASSVALGKGTIDIPAVLRAALQMGVKKFYIEDEAMDAAKQIPQSLKYIQSLP